MVKPWRLHLANSAIQHIDIIGGKPVLMAVWTRDGKVAYYDLEKGDAHGTAAFILPEKKEDVWAFATGLKDPKGRRLAFARVGGTSFWALAGGGMIEYYGGTAVDLHKAADEPPQTMTFDVKPSAIAVNPETQLVAALDMKGALLLGQPGGSIKTMKPGLSPQIDLPLSAAVARSGKRIVVSDGARLIVIDSGKVSIRRDLHYVCGMLALSPDGKTLVVFDSDSGVLRVYDPDGLVVTHQRFVVDLLSSAEELQLIGFAELPPVSAALSALAVDNDGRIAFAVSGQVSVASVKELTPTANPPASGKAAPAKKETSATSGKSGAKSQAKGAGSAQKSGAAARSVPAPAVTKSPESEKPAAGAKPDKPDAAEVKTPDTDAK